MAAYDDLLALIGTPGDECIEWPRARDPRGYGVVWRGGQLQRATHLALDASGAERSELRQCALHSCDNPPCVNPRHLSWGTKGENSRQMARRGRHTGTLQAEQIPTIRQLIDFGCLYEDIARCFNTSRRAIQAIADGQTWEHIK